MEASELAVALVADDAMELRELERAAPSSRRDRVLVLQQIYDLHRAPLSAIGDRVHWQHHPAVAELKGRLEAA